MPNHLELVTNLAIIGFIVVAGGLYAKDHLYQSPAAASPRPPSASQHKRSGPNSHHCLQAR
jgi:hypothetical protein